MGVICKALGRVSETQEPCVMVDPFAGTATTAIAAMLHGSHFIGTESSNHCHTLAEKRISDFDLNMQGSELYENIQKRKEEAKEEAKEAKVCCVISAYASHVYT